MTRARRSGTCSPVKFRGVPADAVTVSHQDIVGIGGALARVNEIQALLSTGASPSPAVPAGTTLGSGSSPTGAPPSAPGAGFAGLLSQAQGTAAAGATGPVGAAQALTQTPGAPEMARQIDEWIARKNPESPLQGYGAVFVREGLANGIDPRALAAIARAESSLGSDPGARSINNAFGWGPHRPFATWEENIATVAAGLKKGYIDEGLTTLAQIQAKYAPLGAANDPGGLNSNWLTNTTLLYGELGGNPVGSVAVAPSAPGVVPAGTV